MVASDGLNEEKTTVIVNVADVNDLPPVFDQIIYNATIQEETIQAHLPLIKVYFSSFLFCFLHFSILYSNVLQYLKEVISPHQFSF